MSQVINTNVLSLNAQRNLNNSQGALAQSLERLSSGLRINSAKDDAAGLAIAERFTTQIRGLNQAVRNANDGISFAQTAEGALGTVGDALQRIRELAVQSANDTNSASDRQALNNEVQQLVQEINRVANSTEFNGQKILDGSLGDLFFQVGANQNQTISVTGVDTRGSVLGAAVAEGGSVDVETTDLEALTDITVQGVSIDLSDVDSLNGVVAAINNELSTTGVEASRATTVNSGELAFDSTGNDGFVEINGVQINVNDGEDTADFIERVNSASAQTGVVAEAGETADTIILSNTSGADIEIVDADEVLGGTGDQTFSAGIVLAADVGTEIEVGGTDATALGGLDATATEQNTLNAVDVLNRENATQALGTLDFALQQVSGLRSELGAVQIRFENTISNLEISSENLSAARSRIQDADFAAETAELTRAQVLQQAGTSVLSQANAVPQNVLALLQ
ncbi:flagellin [Thioalkalivibrio sp. ALE17]|uniref:flagellin N-terminal helical domain-containing protein n=1 Tax=Thioalkalivibrio sp. ALE17 TaxID=1158173 RepID=UPI00041CD308|nr:flagellin [Thioalkalivibrio sp. ALE17]